MSRTRGVPTSCPVPCRSARHPARWRRYASIALRTREPALKRGERVDQLMGLEGAVARPMLTCTSTPASTRRSIARLVAWNDRPTSSDAVDVGSTGAAGRASIRRLTAESRQMRPTRPRQPDCSSRTRSSKRPVARRGEERDPAVDAGARPGGVGRADVARPVQSVHVVL